MPIRLKVEVISDPDPIPFAEISKAFADMVAPTNEALTHLHSVVSKYPPKPAGSTYVRTGNLKASWQPKVIGSNGVLGQVSSISSKAPYNVYVQDGNQQAPVHVGRWQTAQDVAESEQAKVLEIFETWGKQKVSDL